MEKYIVIVNHKYLVSVEAGSHGGAEHRCLDLVYGIEYAQAFSRDDLRTEFFRDNAINCETVSLEWLAEQSKAYKAALDYEAEALRALEENHKRLQELRREFEILNHNSGTLQQNIIQSKSDRLAIL